MDLQQMSMVLIVLCITPNKAVTTPVPDSQSGPGPQADIDGSFLYALGTNTSSPLLRLIGQTFQRYDDKRQATEQRLTGELKASEQRLVDNMCASHPCTEWQSWSVCSVRNKGQFGVTSRSRDCISKTKVCSNVDTSSLLTVESGVCEGRCVEAYTHTGGYCLKLYNTQALSQSDAQTACQQDGGHLVNVNTKAKSDVMHAILKNNGITSASIWINGMRTQTAGDWHYTYGSVPDFDNWYKNEPSNGATELCKVDDQPSREWCDRACSTKYHFVCELI